MIKIRHIHVAAFVALFFYVAAGVGAAAAPSIDKTSVQVRVRYLQGYQAPGEAEPDSTISSWMPVIDFRVNGPLAAGSQLWVEFKDPSGRPWLKFDCASGEAPEDGWWRVEGCGAGFDDSKGSIATGPVGFSVNLKNELAGTSRALFEGRLNVKRYHIGIGPKEKEKYEYYVDYDWNLPLAYVFVPEPEQEASGGVTYGDYAPLSVAAWFRGQSDNQTVAYLFHKGKQVGSTATTLEGVEGAEVTNTTSNADPRYTWSRRKYTFTGVLAFNREDPDNHPEAFRMDRNPGEYEVKILRSGQLARAFKFAVGSDGKIVETGLGPKYGMGTRRTVVPTQVLGDKDTQWNRDAWKTDAFFGNLLSGFSPA